MWMKNWDNAALQEGCNPHIGPSVINELINVGLNAVNCKFIPISASGIQPRYGDIIENFKGFYMGEAADNFGINDESLKKCALDELKIVTADSFVMDAVFASWGSKI